MCLEQKERTVARDARVKERHSNGSVDNRLCKLSKAALVPEIIYKSFTNCSPRLEKVGRQWASLEGRALEGSSITRGMNLPGKTAEERGLYEIRSDCANDRINLLPPVNRFPREDKNL